jgi:hypothetical protein|tara:strand:+ start:762 stop:1136 length:375 start_codon:yes stop_codon:yes gene_type:complete
MQTQTATSTSTKRAPARKVTKKPLSKAQVNAVPKPVSTGRGAVRTLYKFIGEVPEAKGFTPQMRALIVTVSEAKKGELDSSSFTAQDLVALAVKKGNLTTNQDPLRIFRFYAKRLVEEGYFTKV